MKDAISSNENVILKNLTYALKSSNLFNVGWKSNKLLSYKIREIKKSSLS